MYLKNVVFFRSVLFPIVQNHSIPTIGHSDIYLFLIPIINLAEETKNKNDSFIECFCITCDRIYARVSPPAPLILSFQPFQGVDGGEGGWADAVREKNLQNACVEKMFEKIYEKSINKCVREKCEKCVA